LKLCFLLVKGENTFLQARHQASNVDSHSAQSTDEAFLSKESSQEELDERLEAEDRDFQDSEEYEKAFFFNLML
jgi:hypothetical protein